MSNNSDESKNQGEIMIYQGEDGATRLDVHFVDETIWLSQQQMAELFQTSRSNVVEHIKHIYEEQELEEVSTCRKFRQVRTEGKRTVTREIPFYNLPPGRENTNVNKQPTHQTHHPKNLLRLR